MFVSEIFQFHCFKENTVKIKSTDRSNVTRQGWTQDCLMMSLIKLILCLTTYLNHYCKKD